MDESVKAVEEIKEDVKKDTRSRKWLITINNPHDKGLRHDEIKEILKKFKGLTYWCMADEIGNKTKKYHTHIFLVSNGAIRFSTLNNRFPGGHFDMAKGTSEQNRDYVFKEGKWEGDKKQDTSLPETKEEYGECPVERPGARNDIADLYAMLKEGMSDYQILEDNPSYMLRLKEMDGVRQTILEEKYRQQFRNLEVTYIWGASGRGKTRYVMDTYGYENVYRVVDYDHPFDGYKGQDVVLFEEFASNISIYQMLLYLDGYPLELPCRYRNKVACYTKVYFTTNIELMRQYEHFQSNQEYPTWEAFLRRIHRVIEYTAEDIKAYDIATYLRQIAGWVPVNKTFWQCLEDKE